MDVWVTERAASSHRYLPYHDGLHYLHKTRKAVCCLCPVCAIFMVKQVCMPSWAAAWNSGAEDSDVYKINLRRDTFTMPTAAMKEAMVTAPLGDDVYGEDPTVNKLQEERAALLGQEAALLVPTGTMGNISALLTHCSQYCQEILLGDQSHIYLYEVGRMAALAGLQPRAVTNKLDGTLDLVELQSKIRPRDDPHSPWTRVICLENTHNKCEGTVLSLDYIKQGRLHQASTGVV